MTTETALVPGTTETSLCQVCQCPLFGAPPIHTCTSCGSVFHQECWQYVGGCAVYGCREMYETRKADGDSVLFWGAAEKRCAMCAEMIPVGDLVCGHCGTSFNDVRPMTREDMVGAPEKSPPTPLRRTAVAMLILSVLGVTSPLVVVFGGIWYLRKRRHIAEEGPTTRAIAILALVIGVLYALMVAVGVVAFRLGSIAPGGEP